MKQNNGAHLNPEFCRKYGPYALVAGASQGLGAAYAARLAALGLNLVLVARTEDRLRALAGEMEQQYGVQVRALVLDLSGEGAAPRIVEQTADLEIGLLVYNAAYAPVTGFFDVGLDDHLRSINTNVRTPLALTYLLGQRMLPRKHGGIILLSSLSASQGSAYIANYAATKAYNLILAEGLWDELGRAGIDVLAVSPGAVSTPGLVEDLPEGSSGSPIAATTPQVVVEESLVALGKGPNIIPGLSYRLSGFFVSRVMPKRAAIRMMGRVMRGMYKFK